MGVAIISAAAALVGAIVGVGGGIWIENRKWEREREVRWDDSCRDARISLLLATDALFWDVGIIVEGSQGRLEPERLEEAKSHSGILASPSRPQPTPSPSLPL